MQVTGTIQSVFATQEGGYQSNQGNYIYTFDMVIDTPQGPMTGEIGSTAQPYPLAPGQPITVDVRQTDRGPRFKKINPQHAGQGGQGSRPPTQQNRGVSDRKKVLGMCFTNLLSARLANTPAVELVDNKAELEALSRLAGFCVDGTSGMERGNTDAPAGQDYPDPANEDPY